MIERFLSDFPTDGLVPLARIVLALTAMSTGDMATADTQLSLTAGLPPGTARDLWITARARSMRLRGDADGALALLGPLVGKNVDPVGRLVFEEELTLAAIATGRDYEAISYMDAWLRASAEEDRAHVVAQVAAVVEGLRIDVLVGALKVMRAQRASLGYGGDIERILSDRLVREATSKGDAELALMLLDPDAGAIAITGDAGLALVQVATSRRGLNAVAGRTIGLLLPAERPGLRDESADVLRGVTWALGIPPGIRSVRPAATTAAERTSPYEACGALEPAPDLGEPTPSDGVHLVTRNDSGDPETDIVALDELAGEGAAIVIAGLDGPSAALAGRWAEMHRVPVVVLSVPTAAEESASFAFSLGQPRDAVVRALVRAAPAFAIGTVAPVIDASEVAGYSVGEAVPGLHLSPPVPCDIPAVRAGDYRFPIGQWERDKTRGWLVSGASGCASDVLTELTGAHMRGTLALTLEAASGSVRAPGLRVLTAQAGIVPVSAPADPRAAELRRFEAALGSVSWWVALGRDAATLARAAVLELPVDTVTAPRAVADRRAEAQGRLATARARLWSTGAAGWADGHAIGRTVCALDVGLAGP
jgi:hypothetical protein